MTSNPIVQRDGRVAGTVSRPDRKPDHRARLPRCAGIPGTADASPEAIAPQSPSRRVGEKSAWPVSIIGLKHAKSVIPGERGSVARSTRIQAPTSLQTLESWHEPGPLPSRLRRSPGMATRIQSKAGFALTRYWLGSHQRRNLPQRSLQRAVCCLFAAHGFAGIGYGEHAGLRRWAQGYARVPGLVRTGVFEERPGIAHVSMSFMSLTSCGRPD